MSATDLYESLSGNQPQIIAAAAFIVSSAYLLSRRRAKKERRLSFTSVGLGIGSFPPSANVKEPIINTAVYFDDCPSAQDVADMIITPLLKYERLSHVPDIDNHVCRPSHGYKHTDLIRELAINEDDDAILNKTIVEHCQDTLGSGRDDLPWWEILIIRNSGKGSSACVIRIHHVIADGLALVSAFEKILTDEDGNPIVSPISFKSSSSSVGGGDKKKKKGLLSTARSLVEATAHVLTLGATKYDDDTAFSKMNHTKMKHSGKREAVIFPTIPLDFVKSVKTAANVTVNDLLMTAVSQAIHSYCKEQGDSVLLERGPEIQCRALLPVGFPRSTESLNDPLSALRNIWCMVSCDLGVGYEDILERLKYIHAKTTEMKEKPRAFMQLTIQNKVAPYIPVSVGQQTVFDTFSRHSLVLTNVPGPSKRCLFAGAVVKSVQLFFDNLLTQVDLMSYAGNVYGNMIFDADELTNPESFKRFYVEALIEIANRLNVDVPADVKAMQ
jgi:hypothetical protein